MARYIEESCVLERFKPYVKDCGYDEQTNSENSYISVEDAMNVVADTPSSDVAPVKHGSWSNKMVAVKERFFGYHGDDARFGFRCSECGEVLDKTLYCGNCGTKMDLTADGGDD